MVGMDMRFWCTVILHAREEYCLCISYSQNHIDLNFQREKLPPVQLRGRY